VSTLTDPQERADARGRRPRRPFGEHSVTTAVLLATVAGPDGPAAALPWEDTTVLGRLLDQLADLGIREPHIVVRPETEEAVRAAAPGSIVHRSGGPGEDLRLVAEIARAGDGGLVVGSADIVTQREALAGLLIDPRVATGALITAGRIARPFGLRTRSARGRILSASSPYHAVHQPNTTFLGVVKVAEADRPQLAEVAEQLAPLADEPSAAWREELAAKATGWRRALVRRMLSRDAADGEERERIEPEELDALPLPAPEQAELERRLAAAPDDVPALLVVGLVRAGAHVGVNHLRALFWARPLSREDVERAAEEVTHHDEDKALLDSAVKASDGFFTTYFVSPYSRYIARWSAHAGLTPNQVTSISVVIGLVAAIAFATGERWGMVAGAILLQAAFTMDCVDGQLARYTRTFSKLGAWLDSIFDRTKEYLVFAGLAIGATKMGQDVWLLAGAALALQTARHHIDFSYPAAQHQVMASLRLPPIEEPADGNGRSAAAEPDVEYEDEEDRPPPSPEPPESLGKRLRRAWRRLDRSRRVRWVKKIAHFPIGERFATISILAALTTPRTTFIVVLAWGGFAMSYILAGRGLRSLRSRARAAARETTTPSTTLEHYRDDGPLATLIGRALGRHVPAPQLALLAAAALPVALAMLLEGGDADWPVVAGVVAWLVVLGGISSGRPLRGSLRWAVPPVLRAIEYGTLLWCAALAADGSVAGAFALLSAVAFRHYDLVYRLRHRGAPAPPWVTRLALGWDGRLVLAFALLAAGALPAGFYVWAALLGAVLAGESVTGWIRFNRSRQRPLQYDDDEEDLG